MILPDIVQKIRASTCAVLYMPVKHEKAYPNAKIGDKVEIHPKDTEVIATGFLVKDDLVLTNRHVIAAIYKDYQKKDNYDHWYMRFTYPDGQGGWNETTKRLKKLFTFVDPAFKGQLEKGGLDIGLLSFDRKPGEMDVCQPVEFGELDSIAVGTDIALCGFPFGSKLLSEPELGLARFGAVFHQGIISGVSPFDTVDPRSISTFLTDLNTAGGMSGSPVFLPESGRVIGLHYAGTQGTLGHEIPIDQQRIEGWVSFYHRVMKDTSILHELHMSPGGDIVNP